jgi:hypothetical protein
MAAAISMHLAWFFMSCSRVRVFQADPHDLKDALDTDSECDHAGSAWIMPPDLPGDDVRHGAKMLRKDPQERYRDCGMVADACDAYLRLCGCLLTSGRSGCLCGRYRSGEIHEDEGRGLG